MPTRGKRQREQTTKGGSGISPPNKKASTAIRRRKDTIQTSISEWIIDDSITHSQSVAAPINKATTTTSPHETPNTPPHSQLTCTQPVNMLSPILSQPMGSEERNSSSISHDTVTTSPVSNVLNLAASAASLRRDFATCERIMTEKHQFLVTMLDGMNNSVSSIAEKLGLLESRVKVLEENENTQSHIARGIFQAANKRQNELEQSLRDHATVISSMQQKCDKVDELSTRVHQLENFSQRQEPQTDTSGEKISIAIYGLHTYDDVTAAVDHLFVEMNLRNIECNAAYRTPPRPDANKSGIVIAEMKSLRDKRAVLERKRFLRNIPQYRDVYIKSSKTHAEQVMTANFTVMLNELSNGDLYYMSDNGRIRQKSTDQYRYTSTQNQNGGNNFRKENNFYGGARPKSTNYRHNSEYKYDPSVSRSNHYHYTSQQNSAHTTVHSTNPVRYDGAPRRSDDYRRNDENKRPTIDNNDYDLYSVQNQGYHNNYGTYPQQYIDRSRNPQLNQQPNEINSKN